MTKEQDGSVEDLLEQARNVTNNYLSKKAPWSFETQFAKIDEEVKELKQAKTELEALEEGSDVIYAVLTFWHLLGIDDYAIKEALESTMKKIEERSRKALDRNGLV